MGLEADNGSLSCCGSRLAREALDEPSGSAVIARISPFHLLLGIAVNFVWGLAFLVPHLLAQTDPVLVACGRYGSYGVLSLGLLLLAGPSRPRLHAAHWRRAFGYALAGNVGYYIVLTLAIRDAGIPVPALIVGTLPVTIMLYGNWQAREIAFSRLLLPALLIVGGLLSLKLGAAAQTAIPQGPAPTRGTVLAVLALLLWTWFGVDNARYMKRHPRLSSQLWSQAIGVCSLLQVLVLLPVYFCLVPDAGHVGNSSIAVLAGCSLLGVVVSWWATAAWNEVSRQLPVVLSGQLIVFETLSSLLYGYLSDARWPQPLELACIASIVAGVLLGLRQMRAL